MANIEPSLKRLMAVLLLSGTVIVGGCADGVELQGGVFDALGVSGVADRKVSNAKLDARPGLILPPQDDRLPDPATAAQNVAAVSGQNGEAWPVDHDERKLQSKAEQQKRHAEHCEKAISLARMRGDSGVIMGPLGNCQPGAFGPLLGVITGKNQ